MSDLLTAAEAADILGMSESGVYRLIARGHVTRRATAAATQAPARHSRPNRCPAARSRPATREPTRAAAPRPGARAGGGRGRPPLLPDQHRPRLDQPTRSPPCSASPPKRSPSAAGRGTTPTVRVGRSGGSASTTLASPRASAHPTHPRPSQSRSTGSRPSSRSPRRRTPTAHAEYRLARTAAPTGDRLGQAAWVAGAVRMVS